MNNNTACITWLFVRLF